MRPFSAIVSLIFFAAAFPFSILAREQPAIEFGSLNRLVSGLATGEWESDLTSGISRGTNGVYVKYGDVVLTADAATFNQQTGEVEADGHVRIEMDGQIWVGDHIRYDFKTHQMQSEEFRTGKSPVFAQGEALQGDVSNRVYTAKNAFVTTDDISRPALRIRARRIKIIPGKSVEAWNAVVMAENLPVFYFPYYKHSLDARANNFNFLPGYRSAYGPFLLSTYSFFLNDDVDGKLHLDYRAQRGLGAGPDLNLNFGRWGEASLKYYYLHDRDANESTNGFPFFGSMPENRQRFYFAYQSTPFTNLNAKALVNYQSDALVEHDFFEGDYAQNPQPNTFAEINRYWNNWSLDAEATPQVNNFFDQVERLPDVKLTGFRQQIFGTPVYYESESSAGYYRTFFADTNGVAANTNNPYAAARADTFHQLLLPETFFGWLNVTPRVGGRFTYYSSETGPGATNTENDRAVFNTGVEVSFKASRLWPEATNSFLQINGLRHIIVPSANYVFVPNPSAPPSQLPQFDSESPSLQLLPIDFPDYNDIDSIDSENVIRFGLRNTLQTKRDGQLDTLLDWNLMLDWRLKPDAGQQTFNDLYSVLRFKPRSWLALDSQARYDINDDHLNMTFTQLTFAPGERWSWGLGHWYLRNGFIGSGDDYFTSTFFVRVNDNWGVRAEDDFNAETGRLQQQFYSLYRDLRWWTCALTFRLLDNGGGQPNDYTIAFTFSFKANPRYHLGEDTVSPYRLIGE